MIQLFVLSALIYLLIARIEVILINATVFPSCFAKTHLHSAISLRATAKTSKTALLSMNQLAQRIQIVIGIRLNNNVIMLLNVLTTFSMTNNANCFQKPALTLPSPVVTKVHLAVQGSVERNAKLT